MPQSHNIWVQYTESDLDNTFQGHVPSFPGLCNHWTPEDQILHYMDHLPCRQMISTFTQRSKKTPQCILHPHAQGYMMVIATKYKDPHGWAHCVDWFILVVKQTDQMDIEPGRAIVEPAHVVWETAASDRINTVWLVNNHVALDTYWTVY